MSAALAHLKETIAHLEFSLRVRAAMSSVRLIHETDDETFARLLRLVQTAICPDCRGYGHRPFTGDFCEPCKGTGERPHHDAKSTKESDQ